MRLPISDIHSAIVCPAAKPPPDRARRRGHERYPVLSGIYFFLNTATGELYIGQSHNITERYKSHLSRLRRGAHPVAAFQASYERHGAEAFQFVIAWLCDGSGQERLAAETGVIRRLRPALNGPKPLPGGWPRHG